MVFKGIYFWIISKRVGDSISLPAAGRDSRGQGFKDSSETFNNYKALRDVQGNDKTLENKHLNP